LLQYTGLPAFQDTQANHGEYIELWNQRHTGTLVTICWLHHHFLLYYSFRLNAETCYRKLLWKRPWRVLSI